VWHDGDSSGVELPKGLSGVVEPNRSGLGGRPPTRCNPGHAVCLASATSPDLGLSTTTIGHLVRAGGLAASSNRGRLQKQA
jgi:hypothetical protein